MIFFVIIIIISLREWEIWIINLLLENLVVPQEIRENIMHNNCSKNIITSKKNNINQKHQKWKNYKFVK